MEMGKKRNTNKVTLALPVAATTGGKGGGSVCGREGGRGELTDISDLESNYTASAAGDFGDTDPDDENDLAHMVDTFGDQVENAQDKRIETRLKAIDNLLLVLNKHYIPDSVDKWKCSIIDVVEKSLRRSQQDEAQRVCSLASLVSLQLGVEIEDQICEPVAQMRQICADDSASEQMRSCCAQAIGLCVYLSIESRAHRFECLQTLKGVWSGMKPSSTVGTTLFSSALASWTLLLERFDPAFISVQIAEMQPKICAFLESTTVEARISAGEALAILHEIAVNNIDEDFQFRNQPYLESVLGELSVDSSKNRARRDKKLQKMSFRQISDVICNDNLPQQTIRFNKRETLHIRGCHNKLLYDSLCQLLRSDLNSQLTKNVVLRELFDLGAILEMDEPTKLSKTEKQERLNQFGEQKKQMHISRSKGRAKKNDHRLDFED